AKADQMDHQNVRWAAGLWMEARTGAVQVVWNWTHWGHPTSDIYRITDIPDAGFKIERRFPYLSRLSGFTTRYVVAEAQREEGRPQIVAAPPWVAARGVAVFPDGRVVVGDFGGGRLLVYRPDGQPDPSWPSAPSAGQPSDVAVSRDGRLAVLDGGSGDLSVLDGTGQVLMRLTRAQTGIGSATGLAWAPDGSLYVADTSNGRVAHIRLDGTAPVALTVGAGGVPLPNQPLDVAVTPDGTVYAVDLAGRLVRFDAAGTTVQEWKLTAGGAAGGGSRLAVWGPTLLAISDPDGNALLLFDTATGLARSFPVPADTPLHLLTPVGVAAGPSGQLYLLDSGHNRVVLLDLPR
ncbi:MAG: NHL repeat-containing protein, partial [Chloroflexota bacterium]|nr:NHL repeat-containing protein [Chloroflexota bacterium]